MTIATKKGDDGTTGLMYNRRVSKCHPRVEAYGNVDELNAALGTARAASRLRFLRQRLIAIQKDLIIIMGELATRSEDAPRYVKDGFPVVTPALTARLDAIVQEIESKLSVAGWYTPGETAVSAALDVARTVCRRAERRVCALRETGENVNKEIIVFLNRLSDALWLMARWVEPKKSTSRRRS